MITIGLFQPDRHYETVSKWWTDQKWPVIPLSHLSQTGVLVSLDGKPAAVGWIYRTDSAYCLFEWIVASPDVRHEVRSNVLSVLISGAKMMAKQMGFKSIYMNTKHESLGKRVEAHGFVACDQGVTDYVCEI